MAETQGFPARRAALRLIDAVRNRGETLDQAAGNALKDIEGADRALALAIASEVLRWQEDLDSLIDSATRKRLPDDAKPRAVLQIMLAQTLRLRTPPHAVIATALPLLSFGPRRLAHGVFSTLNKRKVTLPDVPTLPADVRARWGERGSELAKGLANPPDLDLTLRNRDSESEWQGKLGGMSLAPRHLRLPRGTSIESMPGFSEGAWWVQDMAASIPARLLGEGRGRDALDLCAAPGGKTLQLAAAGWTTTALDISEKRLGRLRDNLLRTRLSAEIVVADALEWEPDLPFDAILLDAPCTATGTCRRHPDVLHRIGPRQIEEMAELQRALVERAARWLKPGGKLVYSVCSLEPEEGEDQVAHIPLELDPILPEELPDGLSPSPEGWLRTDPSMIEDKGGLDGFFIARFVRPRG